MADPVSALDRHYAPGRFGTPGQAAVTLEEVKVFSLLQLAAWPATVAELSAQCASALGVAKAPDLGKFIRAKTGSLLRIGPLTWWLITEGSAPVARPVIPPAEGSPLDMSHSTTWLKIGGKKADDLLNHFLPIDLRDASFPPGSVASTVLHHTGVTLWRTDRHFNLLLPRSFALSLWELLQESTMQYGFDVI